MTRIPTILAFNKKTLARLRSKCESAYAVSGTGTCLVPVRTRVRGVQYLLDCCWTGTRGRDIYSSCTLVYEFFNVSTRTYLDEATNCNTGWIVRNHALGWCQHALTDCHDYLSGEKNKFEAVPLCWNKKRTTAYLLVCHTRYSSNSAYIWHIMIVKSKTA